MKYILAILVLCCASAFGQSSPWPGQSGNVVGYASYGSLGTGACGFTSGSFTSGSSWAARQSYSPCRQSGSNITINCSYCQFIGVDWQMTGGLLVTGSNVTFIGNRFSSNNAGDYNIQTTGSNIYIVRDSLTPLASFYTSPPGSLWPSAGAGANSALICTTGQTTLSCNGTLNNSIDGNQGYEYGINIVSGGPVFIFSSDFWGFGNAIPFANTTAQMVIENNWMHDIANPNYSASSPITGQGYHTDGPGYLNSTAAPTNVRIQGNTVCMLGNTNSLALQQGTSGYTGMQINGNYFCGDGDTIALCQPSTYTGGSGIGCTGTFARNDIGTDVQPLNALLYNTGIGPNLTWTGNKLIVRSGTTWTSGSCTPTSGMNNQFWLPTSGCGNSSTDQGSNTHTGNLSVSSLLWLPSAANQQTITLTAGNTGNLAVSSITPSSQFSESDNCVGTVANGASCTITVTYAPTGTGPVPGTLSIATNDPSSPEIVDLLGIDAPSSSQAVAPNCSPSSGAAPQSLTCLNTNTSPTVMCEAASPTTPVTNLAGTGCTTGTNIGTGSSEPFTVSTSGTYNFVAGTNASSDSSVSSYTYSSASAVFAASPSMRP